MRKTTRARFVAVAIAALSIPPAALAGGDDGDHDHDHDHHEFHYQDADCTPVDDAAGDDSMQVVEEREHHGNGRTECVLVDGQDSHQAWPDGQEDDYYIAYSPYQGDTVEGNSAHDRGPALRYHNGDKYTDGSAHAHGAFGCWNKSAGSPVLGGGSEEENTAEAAQGEAELQRSLNEAGAAWAGKQDGFAQMVADQWYTYPVAASKAFHMVRFDGVEGRVDSAAIEVFTSAQTDDGWQHLNGMFTLGNEGEDPVYAADGTILPKADKDGDGYVDNDVDTDYKQVREDHLPLWRSPYTDGVVCDLPWHVHTGYEGVATSFDSENPDVSGWMAHVDLYLAEGDPWALERGADGSEPHAYWEPLRHVPALCNPSGPCL